MSRRTMDRINGMSRTDALAAFKACCGSTKYAEVTSASSASARVRSGLPGRVGTAPLHASLPAKLKGTCWALAQGMVAAMPFGSAEELKRKSDSVWSACGRQDILEAFLAHPKIGDSKGAKEHGGKWASNEQKGMQNASSGTAAAMAQGNTDYEAKMGFRYIVCATGKSAEEMLGILQNRLNNTPEEELINGAAEQNKITHLRLDKLLTELTSASL